MAGLPAIFFARDFLSGVESTWISFTTGVFGDKSLAAEQIAPFSGGFI